MLLLWCWARAWSACVHWIHYWQSTSQPNFLEESSAPADPVLCYCASRVPLSWSGLICWTLYSTCIFFLLIDVIGRSSLLFMLCFIFQLFSQIIYLATRWCWWYIKLIQQGMRVTRHSASIRGSCNTTGASNRSQWSNRLPTERAGGSTGFEPRKMVNQQALSTWVADIPQQPSPDLY